MWRSAEKDTLIIWKEDQQAHVHMHTHMPHTSIYIHKTHSHPRTHASCINTSTQPCDTAMHPLTLSYLRAHVHICTFIDSSTIELAHAYTFTKTNRTEGQTRGKAWYVEHLLRTGGHTSQRGKVWYIEGPFRPGGHTGQRGKVWYIEGPFSTGGHTGQKTDP